MSKPSLSSLTREQRVRHIAQMMASGQWLKSYTMRCQLAAEWGVAEQTIREYSAEASRLLATDPAEREQLRVALASRLLEVAETAMATPNIVTGQPDFRSAIQAYESYAKFASIAPETTQQSTLPPTIQVVLTDSPAEQAAVASVPSDKAE